MTNRTIDGEELRVAQVIGSFGGGGAQRQAYNLISALGRQGVYSRGIAVRAKGGYAESGAEEIESLGADRTGLVRLVAGVFRLRRLIRRWKLNGLQVHGAKSLPYVMLATLCMSRRPVVVFVWQDSQHVLEPRPGLARRLTRWAIRRCDRVYGSSVDVVGRLEAGAGLSGVGVFHGGVPARPAVRPVDGAPPMILWMGRLVPPKDPAALVRAAAALRKLGYSFTVCMTGGAHAGSDYGNEIAQLVSDLGIGDIVSLHGHVDDSKLSELLGRADIAVQTSHTEGMSMALLEQMMAGVAVVATDVGDTRHAVIHERTGLLVRPRDDEGLVSAIRRLLDDPGLRRTVGAAAREFAIAEFSLDAMAKRAVAAFRGGSRSCPAK